MDLISKEFKLKAHCMGLKQRIELANWLTDYHEDDVDYPDDLDRIQGILHDAGYELTFLEIQDIWWKVSEVHDSGWLELPKYDQTILTTFEAIGDLHEY